MMAKYSRMVWMFVTFLIFASPVRAVGVSISGVKEVINETEEMLLDVSLTCEGCSDSYLRGAFFQSGNNYFGLTKNNQGEWIGTSGDRTAYFKVGKEELKEGSWSGRLVVKVDVDEYAYKGSGNYFFKVARYTARGSATWSSEVGVKIQGSMPTVTATPTGKALTSTVKPTVTPLVATNIPTAIKIPTKVPTAISAVTPKIEISGVTKRVVNDLVSFKIATTEAAMRDAEKTEIMGVKVETGAVGVKVPEDTRNLQRILVIILLAVGAGSAVGAGGVFWYKHYKLKSETKLYAEKT